MVSTILAGEINPPHFRLIRSTSFINNFFTAVAADVASFIPIPNHHAGCGCCDCAEASVVIQSKFSRNEFAKLGQFDQFCSNVYFLHKILQT